MIGKILKVFDDKRYAKLAVNEKKNFQTNVPFNYAVFGHNE